MDLLSVIRRWHGRDKLSIRAIARCTGLSRNTIRKYLANGEVQPKYPARKGISKLDPFAETLASWLERESKRNRKRRRNLKQLHRDLVALGFDGSYDRVAAFARDCRQRERERAIFGNMKTAVDKVGRGKQREVNARFRAMASHFLFETEFCKPAAGWEKGQVEKNVRDARHRLLQDAPEFADLGELNAWLEARCQALWQETANPEQSNRTVAEVYADERSALMAVPPPFDGFIEYTKRVSPTCLVIFEHNRYSVPATLANRVVSLRAYADKIVLVAEAEVVAEHVRAFNRGHKGPGQTVYDWRHYLAVVQRKPGALRNGAPLKGLPASFKRLRAVLMKRDGGDREMADILALVLHHDEKLVEQAVREAVDTEVISKTQIVNRLSRLLDTRPPQTLTPPPALTLTEEPIANTERYDNLRGMRHVR